MTNQEAAQMNYTAAPDVAVREAYLMSLARAAAVFDQQAAGEVLASFSADEISWDDAVMGLEEIYGAKDVAAYFTPTTGEK